MTLTYAIGDIHGRDDLLASALDWIDSHGRGGKARRIVFLGDYVDRGPNSAAVIARLMEGPLRSQDRYVCLRGNHEQMLLDAQTGGKAPMISGLPTAAKRRSRPIQALYRPTPSNG